MSGADNLHAAAGSRLALDDLTLHGRSILSQVERSTMSRDLTDYLAQVLSAFKAASAEAFVV
ncbi:hypothetical protein [Bradyrhizobium elkanii]|uniref:hypothetical protein n=1 Tax=Bradyrhizobium elkanii TaxID=29448 RepID=UPI003513E31B